MALMRRHSIAKHFKNNKDLQQFVLTDVTPTGRILGTGSFGSVEEVRQQIRIYRITLAHECVGYISEANLCWQENT